MKILSRGEIENIIKELSPDEIIETAYNGWNWQIADGVAMVDIRTGDLITVENPIIRNYSLDTTYYIKLYTLPESSDFDYLVDEEHEELTMGMIIEECELDFELENYKEQLDSIYCNLGQKYNLSLYLQFLYDFEYQRGDLVECKEIGESQGNANILLEDFCNKNDIYITDGTWESLTSIENGYEECFDCEIYADIEQEDLEKMFKELKQTINNCSKIDIEESEEE